MANNHSSSPDTDGQAADRALFAWHGWRDPILWALLYLAIVSLFFLLFPGVDVAVARLFYADGSFPAARQAGLMRFRGLGTELVILVVLVLLASLLAKLVWPARPIAIRPRSTIFLLAGLALGPGLVVNGLFKSLSGRPRPMQLEIFGGDAPFVPVWHVTSYCASNCSFVSGEASSAMWLFALVLLTPPALRLYALIPIATAGIGLSLNRIAFGGHFLSDTLLSWGITLLILLILHRLIVAGPLGARIDRAVEAGLGKIGRSLRRFRWRRALH